jgi:hypothetical protein
MTTTGVTFQQFVGGGTTGIIGVLNVYILPTIFTLIFLMFIWGLVRYFIISGADEAAREKGRHLALWGIIGIVVLAALWGIVNILLSTLNIAPTT